MRVIAGTAGGINLLTPKTDLRPTMDMVRGAIFSSLGDFVFGARVLDLFAGTGSLGIEALSRGAVSATLVESDRKACAIIEQNLTRTKLRARVIQLDVFQFLRSRAGQAEADLIFADPPYSKTPGSPKFADDLVRSPELHTTLMPEGLFVLETARGWKLPETALWRCLRQKQYGATEIFVLQPARLQVAPIASN